MKEVYLYNLKFVSYNSIIYTALTMDTIEHFSEFLRKMGTPNFLALGIAVVILWLLISGFVKGLRRRGQDRRPEENTKNEKE